jgi:hypothetical protein
VTGSTKASTLSASPAPIDFGSSNLCNVTDTIISLHLMGCNPITVQSATIQGTGFIVPRGQFPISLSPGEVKDIHVMTLIDTIGGKNFSSATLSFNSTPANALAAIPLTAGYFYPKTYSLTLNAVPSSIITDTAKFMLTVNSSQLAEIKTLDFNLNYNTDLLEYSGYSGSNIVNSSDGMHFRISGNPYIGVNANGSLTELSFTVYLTKDSATDIILSSAHLNISDPNFEECIASVSSSQGRFVYNYICGDRKIAGFINGAMPLKIVSLRPNPSQDEIELDVQSALKQNTIIEIFDALGVKVFSDLRNIIIGSNSIRLDTKGLSGGMYLVRIGGASGSFVKIK